MNRMKPRHLAAGAALALALALLMACGGGPGAGAAGGPSAARGGAPAGDPPGKAAPQQAGARFGRAIPVQAVTVHVGKLTTNNDTTGTIVAVTQSSVASQVAGVVLSVVHQPGDWVKAGTSVVQLDDSQLKLAVQTARSNLDIARINYEIAQDNTSQSAPKLDLQVQSAQSAVDSAQKFYDSQKALLDVGGISASQLDTARSQLQAAQANLESAKTAVDQNKKSDVQSLAQLKLAIDQAQNALQVAQLNLSYAAIKAPFAGQIAAVNVNPGTYVGLNTVVFVLVSADREVAFNVSPADAATLPLGSTVRFAYRGKDYPARVNQAPSAPIGGLVPMVAVLDRSSSLGYGTVGTVSYGLTLGSGALIPIAALQVNEDQNFVFAVVGGKVASRTVKVLAESGTTAAVSGVDDGVQVVINPPPGLLEGAAVQVVSLGAGGAGAGPAAPAPGGTAPGAPAAGAKTGAPSGRTQ
ncbi:MAG TPA: HlyD family efflux transporter periplasmic adaptor subunit [Spirochaetia bacterium]|nr:HlyD family efflux transporter periplasmic adaptor subunit [Spirochaetia bacterium]